MIHALRGAFRRGTHVGIHADMNPALGRRIVLTNVATLAVLVMCALYVPLHLATGSDYRAAILLVEIIALLLVLFANARRHYLAARWLLLLTMNVSVIGVLASAGPSSLVWVCLIAAATISPIPFTSKEWPHALAAMLLAFSVAVLGYSDVLGPLGGMMGAYPFPAIGEAGIVIMSMLVPPILVFWQTNATDKHLSALDQTQSKLEFEVTRAAELTHALELRSEQAGAASKAKSEFLAHMSHEIRTPLAAVISLVDLAKRSNDDTQRTDYLGTAEESAAHLLTILNDILDLSKVEQGGLELETVDFNLAELACDIVALTQVRVVQEHVVVDAHVELHGTPWRKGDPLRLKQVLLNLTGNAAKFTSKGTIHLSITSNATVVRFEVTDTGCGMKPEQLKQAFEAFRQADPSTSRLHGGTGLGLTISRHIVHKMGGALEAHSTPGKGTHVGFEIRLPPGEPPERSTPDQPQPRAQRGLRLLLAEDIAVNRLIAERVLERMGHHVTSVSDGSQAVQRAFEGYDALFMDVQMPIMDGMEATRRIRTLEREGGLDRLPIIALTANAMKGDRELCLAAGMDDHLAKPIDDAHAADVLAQLVVSTPL